MNFDYHTETLRTPALALDYYLVPWDTEIVGQPVAEISRIEVLDGAAAERDYEIFSRWSDGHGIVLCNCRLEQDRSAESMFLEARGFRFIELNYAPYLAGLQALDFPDDELRVEVATVNDRELLADMAERVFLYGRFHQDPRLGSELGNRRYRIWMENAFTHPRQTVLKCSLDGAVVGFFVVEQREPGSRFWSLVGLAPGMQGKGLGKRVWKALLRWHQNEGVDTVSTSISSHNIQVLNLYVALGFRFPTPLLTLHWCAPGTSIGMR